MNRRSMKSFQWFLFLTASLLGSACILETAAGPTPTPQVIVVPGDSPGGSPESALPSPTPESILTLTATETITPEPTSTATTAPVTMTAGQDLSCVTGPHWILYEWVARIADGEIVILLARSTPEWPDYFYARKSDGTECWAFGGSSTVSGNPSTLPEREAPPLPVITFTLRNDTYLRITSLRMRLKDETVWGTNLLAAHPVQAKETYSLTFTAGFYDIRIMDYHDGTIYEAYDIPIGAEPGSSTVVLGGRYSVVFHSAASVDICRVNIEHTASGYSADLTIPGDGRISPGENVTLEAPAGVYTTISYRCTGEFHHGFSSVYFGPAGGGPYNILGG
ncbi:MAG: hypothetical protein WBM17_06105 [Anaerolineales bacterium]